MIKILYLLVILFSVMAHAHPFESPSTWSDFQITKILEKAEVIEIEHMQKALKDRGKKIEFDGSVFLVTLSGGVKAVFKSLPLDDQGDAMAEVAAYKASLYLGFPYVPPTILRQVEGMKGSLQLFVDTPIDLLVPDEYQKFLKGISAEDEANLRIFYFVFGQWDSGAHNLLAYTENDISYPIAIDNSAIRNHQHIMSYGDLPFVRIVYSEKFNTNDWNKPFPFEKAKIIESPSPKNLRAMFGNNLPDSFYINFNSYNQPLKYVIYNNSLWRQYHAFQENFIRAYTDLCPTKALQKLRELNLAELKKIFANSKGADFLTPAYLSNILKRRDQVVSKCARG